MDTKDYRMEEGTNPTAKPQVCIITPLKSMSFIPVKIISRLLAKIGSLINCLGGKTHQSGYALRERHRHYKNNRNENIFYPAPSFLKNDSAENYNLEKTPLFLLARDHKNFKKYFAEKENFVIMKINQPLSLFALLKRMGTIEKNALETFKNVGVSFCLVLVAAFCFCVAPCAVMAETIAYESALVWRLDQVGDYVLPDIAPQSIYVATPAVATKGLIKAITATWKSEGDVRLQVSADDGSHFTPVVNGVSLVSGFVQGSNLKWKATLGEESKLFEVKIIFKDTAGAEGSFGEPELSGFNFRKSLILKGSKTPLFNHQIKIVVGESQAAKGTDISCDNHLATDDFSDVRFASTDGETLLPYYLEKVSGSKPNRTAEFFVKIPELPLEGIVLYLYYGNDAAKSLSNPKATFDFYEDFRQDALDPSTSSGLRSEVWQERLSPGGSIAVSKDGLKIDAATVTSKAFEFKSGIIEVAATAQTGYEVRLIIRDQDPASETDIAQVAYASPYSGAEHCIAVGNFVKVNDAKPITAGTKYIYRVIAFGENLTFERTSDGFGEKQAEVSYKDEVGPLKGAFGLKTAGPGHGESTTTFHWVRVRKLADPEPLLEKNAIGKEESVAPPQFTNTVIAPNGDLILAKGSAEGTYITKGDSADYDIRIISPAWEGKGVTVDISADSGKTYKKNVSNGAYYYAAKGDFTTGRSVKSRLTFKGVKGASVSSLEFLTVQYALGSIVILAPNAGDSASLGSQLEIKWTAWDYENTYPMKIEYSLDAGKTFTTIVKQTENDGSYLWSVPKNTDLLTKEAMICISDSYDEKTQAKSKIFSIVPAVLKADETAAVAISQALAQEAAVSEEAKQAEEKEAAEEEIQDKDLEALIEAGERPGTQLYDLVIKLGDNTSANAEEDTRACYKEGDVVIVQPAGHQWSETERASFLIVQAYLTEKEALELTRSEEMNTGRYDEAGRPIKKTVRNRIIRIDLKKVGLLPEVADREKKLRQIRRSLGDRVLSPTEAIGEVKAPEEKGSKELTGWKRFLNKLEEVLR